MTPSSPGIEPAAAAEVGTDDIRVVRHLQERRPRSRCPCSGTSKWRSNHGPPSLTSFGEQLQGRVELGVAIRVLRDDRRVHAERHVVEEHAVVDRGVVDPTLVAVDERGDRLARVVAIQPEIEGEVIARARRHAHEGQIVLGGDGGDVGE